MLRNPFLATHFHTTAGLLLGVLLLKVTVPMYLTVVFVGYGTTQVKRKTHTISPGEVAPPGIYLPRESLLVPRQSDPYYKINPRLKWI